MPQLLTLKKLRGIHLVDKGAAVGARVVFLKRDNPQEKIMSLKDTILQEVSKILDAAIAKQEPAPASDPIKLIESALAGIKDESTKNALMAAITALYRANPPKPAEPAPAPALPEKLEEKKPEMETAKRDTGDVLKNLDEKTRAAVEPFIKAKQEADTKIEELKKRLDESDKVVAEEVSKRELNEQIEIAKKWQLVPGDIPTRAGLLLSVKKNQGEKAYADLVQSFASANELLAKTHKGTSLGDATHGSVDTDDPEESYAKVKKMAEEIVEKSAGKMTSAKALRKIAREQPELWAVARRAGN